jgi:hypothetical protein
VRSEKPARGGTHKHQSSSIFARQPEIRIEALKYPRSQRSVDDPALGAWLNRQDCSWHLAGLVEVHAKFADLPIIIRATKRMNRLAVHGINLDPQQVNCSRVPLRQETRLLRRR